MLHVYFCKIWHYLYRLKGKKTCFKSHTAQMNVLSYKNVFLLSDLSSGTLFSLNYVYCSSSEGLASCLHRDVWKSCEDSKDPFLAHEKTFLASISRLLIYQHIITVFVLAIEMHVISKLLQFLNRIITSIDTFFSYDAPV